MRTALMIWLMVFPALLQAQGFFSQKKTKLKYIAQQIALLKLYTSYVKKGYNIAKDGLHVISDIKHGDFDMHEDYFSSLNEVNPAVKDYAMEGSVENTYSEILQVNNKLEKFVAANDYLQQDEKGYIKKVMSKLLLECDKDISLFVALTSDSTFALKNNERMERIANIVAGMKDKYAFAAYFENTIKTLALSRAKDLKDAKAFQLLNEIK